MLSRHEGHDSDRRLPQWSLLQTESPGLGQALQCLCGVPLPSGGARCTYSPSHTYLMRAAACGVMNGCSTFMWPSKNCARR